MQKIVLAYNFSPERLLALRLACMMVKVQLRAIQRSEFRQPLAIRACVAAAEPVEEKYDGGEAVAEMLVMCGFSRPDMDRLLAAVKRGSLRQVALKAILTPYNMHWNGIKLQSELSKEHAYMHGRQAPKPRHFAKPQ